MRALPPATDHDHDPPHQSVRNGPAASNPRDRAGASEPPAAQDPPGAAPGRGVRGQQQARRVQLSRGWCVRLQRRARRLRTRLRPVRPLLRPRVRGSGVRHQRLGGLPAAQQRVSKPASAAAPAASALALPAPPRPAGALLPGERTERLCGARGRPSCVLQVPAPPAAPRRGGSCAPRGREEERGSGGEGAARPRPRGRP